MTAAINIPLATADPNSVGSSATDIDLRTLIILAFSATAGVFVEFYDFAIFGLAAASVFPSIFFPKLPATQALVFSYLAYAAGHPARLLGAFIFGHFGQLRAQGRIPDKHCCCGSQFVFDGLASKLCNDWHRGADSPSTPPDYSGNRSGR